LSLFNELKRRNVLRVGAAYSVSAWLVIQVVATIFPAFGFSEAAIRIVTILCIIGLAPTLVLAWAFELTPEGLRQEKDLDGAKPHDPRTGKTLDRIIMVVLALALGYFAIDKFVLDPARDESRIEAATQAARMESRGLAADDRSIAVLPFVNMSSDPEQEYFADGMTEELLNLLAKVPSLKVTARTSSFFFKGRELPIAEIANSLNVRHILEGSIRRSGNRVRITAQLIDAGSEAHLWSETFDREIEDIFQIQDDVAAAIAAALVESFRKEPAGTTARAQNLAAYEAYRTGRLYWWRRTPEGLRKAIELFERARQADPGFAPAYAATAESWLLLVLYGDVHYLEGVNAAEPMIEQALAIDPESPEATAARGLSMLVTGQKDKAEIALRLAVERDEGYIPARVWLSSLLADLGRIPEQGMVLQEAIARDPLNEILAVNYSGNLSIRGEYQQAEHVLEGLLRLQPDSSALLRAKSGIAASRGDLVGAWELAKIAYELDPAGVISINALAQAWWNLGARQQAVETLARGIERVPSNVDLKQQMIRLLLIMGQADEAEDRIYRLFSRDVSALPAEIQRLFHFDLAMLSTVRQDWAGARDHLELAIDPDESQLFDNNQVFMLTTVTLLHRGMGDPELAEKRLSTAERVVGHARVNGVDNGDIYFEVSCLFALRGQTERALQALQQAYDKGWRAYWHLQQDGRLESLREEPSFQDIKSRVEQDIERARQAVEDMLAGGGNSQSRA
jgi:TolB-like protein/Flp pilus assembly protein TadD